MSTRVLTEPLNAKPRVACVVRTIGERTTDLCAELLENEFGQAPERIRTPVHREMVQRCFEYALEQNADVLITVDADVLTYPRGGIELLRLYHSVPSNTFVIVPRIDDHLLGRERVGGLRLYRVSLLRKALEVLPTSSNVRPESSLMAPMAAAGFPSVMAESVCGLHDSEQYLVDVYRKAGFYCHRNVQLVPGMLERWRAPSTDDERSEFQAALLGLADGVTTLHRGPDFAEHAAEKALGVLTERRIVERLAMDADARAAVAMELPGAYISSRWWTFPTPCSAIDKVREARRLGRSLWRIGLVRLLRSLSQTIELDFRETS